MSLLTTHAELDDLGGGRFRHTQHMRPIAYERDGALRRDAFILGASGDPNLTIGCDGISTVRFRPKLSGMAPLIHFGRGQSMVRITPINTNNVDGVKVGANGYRYPNAWNGADLEYTYGGHLLRKQITLRVGHPTTFQFRIDDSMGLDLGTLQSPDFRILEPVLELPGSLTTEPYKWQVSTQGGKTILSVTIPANRPGWVVDPTLTLQPSQADGQDTTLINLASYLNANAGASTEIPIGLFTSWFGRSLIRFPLSTIPRTAICTAATLTVYNVASVQQLSACPASIYAIATDNGDWIEGTGNWEVKNGEPCWNKKVYNTTGWAGSVGCGTSGTDYIATAIGTYTFGDDVAGTAYPVSLAPSTVKSWFGLASNNGVLMRANDEATTGKCASIAASDYATAGYRPQFVTIYSLPVRAPFAAPFQGPFG